MVALGTQVRLPTVQDDGFEAVAAVVAAIFEDGHSPFIIGNAELATGNRPGTG